jgi:hypothetical protein
MPESDGLETNTRVLLCQVCMSACAYVPSCQALSGAASQESSCHSACPVLRIPWVMTRIRSDQTGGKILSICDRRDGRKDRYGSFLSLALFR